MSEITIMAVIAFASVVAILVWATTILHRALKKQNSLLKENIQLLETEVQRGRKLYEQLRSTSEATQDELKRTKGVVDDLQQCFLRIGIDGKLLESMALNDTFWRDSALQLIRCTVDETALDGSCDKKTGTGILSAAHQLVVGHLAVVDAAAVA